MKPRKPTEIVLLLHILLDSKFMWAFFFGENMLLKGPTLEIKKEHEKGKINILRVTLKKPKLKWTEWVEAHIFVVLRDMWKLVSSQTDLNWDIPTFSLPKLNHCLPLFRVGPFILNFTQKMKERNEHICICMYVRYEWPSV